MPADDAPNDHSVQQSYNFAPGYHGLIYRADSPEDGAESKTSQREPDDLAKQEQNTSNASCQLTASKGIETHYRFQAMRWGLIPSWVRRNPGFGNTLRTINCRDDSLIENRGMWVNMKKRKRCVVICHGFYEWLKKNHGKERIPHYVKRKDGQLMCFAGLWDCVQYDDETSKHYTFTIITTNANKQIQFLHDRMPVILSPGSNEMQTWLDPGRSHWSNELQDLLRPWNGQLDIYSVVKDVGKVGNDSPNFIIPLDSKENKCNIANLFIAQQKKVEGPSDSMQERDLYSRCKSDADVGGNDKRFKIESEDTDIHPPMVIDSPNGNIGFSKRICDEVAENQSDEARPVKSQKTSQQSLTSRRWTSRISKKTFSSTSNDSVPQQSVEKASVGSSPKITSFFAKQGGYRS